MVDLKNGLPHTTICGLPHTAYGGVGQTIFVDNEGRRER